MAEFKALIFDCDGVIAETESDGHRIAFNKVFAEEGLGVEWDVESYGEKLKIAGGKERMRTIFTDPNFKKDVGDIDEYIKKLHKRKTDIYMELIENGQLPGREGVKRLVEQAHQHGIRLAIGSTSNERGVNLLAKHVLGEEAYGYLDLILAGDVVSQKKPNPEIYILVAENLDVRPEQCCVIEDTKNGVRAAKAAGMKCVVTRSQYSKDEEFPEADLVVDSLGESENAVTIDTIAALFK
jgi:HAD superfamily hydrolase (TIGR01509 family)